MMDSFLVISSNISEQLFQRTSSDGYFLKVFCETEAVTRSESVKKPLWQIWEISEENVRPLRNMFFFNFSEQNHSITDGSWDFCEMNNCFKERIQVAASEIIWESWLQLQHIDSKGLGQ